MEGARGRSGRQGGGSHQMKGYRWQTFGVGWLYVASVDGVEAEAFVKFMTADGFGVLRARRFDFDDKRLSADFFDDAFYGVAADAGAA